MAASSGGEDIPIDVSELCFMPPGENWQRRLLVVDGCNIGRSASGPQRSHVDCAGLLSVLRWLIIRDFEVVAFMPIVYNNPNNANVMHSYLLTKLEKYGLVTFTPARCSRGDRKAFINYDDLYLTTLATRYAGCVLSGDRFKDIASQKVYEEFLEVILHRTLDVKFRPLAEPLVEFGKDIFYKAAPELFIYEDIATRAHLISLKLFASPDDPDYIKVSARRASFAERRASQMRCVDSLFLDLCRVSAMSIESMPTLPFIDFHVQQYDYNRQPLSQYATPYASSSGVVPWTPSHVREQAEADEGAQFDLINFAPPLLQSQLRSSRSHRHSTASSDESATSQASSEVVCPVGQLVNLEEEIEEKPLIDLMEDTGMKGNLSREEPETQHSYTPRSLLLDDAHGRTYSIDDLLSGSIEEGRGKTTEREYQTAEGAVHEAVGDEEADEGVPEEEESGRGGEDSHTAQLLRDLFPRHIVSRVLYMNVSRNVDFLAEECLSLMASSVSLHVSASTFPTS